jgi:hypothetical protein
MKLAIKSLRDKLSQEQFGRLYSNRSKHRDRIEEQKQIQKAIPMLIWEEL